MKSKKTLLTSSRFTMIMLCMLSIWTVVYLSQVPYLFKSNLVESSKLLTKSNEKESSSDEENEIDNEWKNEKWTSPCELSIHHVESFFISKMNHPFVMSFCTQHQLTVFTPPPNLVG